MPMKGKLPIDEHGIIHVPQGPGVGAELDWDLSRRAAAATASSSTRADPTDFLTFTSCSFYFSIYTKKAD